MTSGDDDTVRGAMTWEAVTKDNFLIALGLINHIHGRIKIKNKRSVSINMEKKFVT